MNEARRFAYILKINGIENFKDYTLLGTEEGFIIISGENKILKVHATGNIKPEKLDKWEKKKETKDEKPFVPKEQPLYKQLKPEDRIFSDTKDLNETTFDEELVDPIYENDDNYDFEPVETVNEIKAPPKISIDDEFKEEIERMKQEQKEMLKGKKPTKKEDPKKDIPGSKPRGWHLRDEYVDSEGNVYHRGKVQPKLKGTKDPTP